ncbi:MAG: hypothetical protein ACR2JI_00690 [Mycobacterium sp.]
MLFSLRPPLIARPAALVGAGAIALAPLAAHYSSSPALQIPTLEMPLALSAASFDQPVVEALGTLNLINSDLFSSNQDCSACEINGGPLTYQGLLPQFISGALPIIRQLGYNAAGYIVNSIEQLFTGPDSTTVTLAHAAWTFLPTAASSGLGPALSGLGVAINQAGHTALAAGQYVLDRVVANLTATAKSLVGFLPGAITDEIGIVTALLAATANVGQQFIAGLSHPGSGESWNALVSGLLGPVASNGLPSIPGAVGALTVGQGLNDTLTADRYVPSIRILVQNVVDQHVLDLNGGTSPHPLPVASTAVEIAVTAPGAATYRPTHPAVTSSAVAARAPKSAAERTGHSDAGLSPALKTRTGGLLSSETR